MQLAGIRQDFLRVTRECDLDATGQSRLPVDQMPLAAAKPVFPALDESRLYAEFRTDQVAPLVPRRVERERQRDRIQDQFCFAPAVTIDCVAIVELNLPEGSPKAPLPAIREERQDLPGEKGLTVRREFSGGKQSAEAAVGKERRRLRIEEQSLIAGAEIGVREEIEGAFDGLDLIFRCGVGLKLEEPHFESQSEIHRCRRRQYAQQIVQSLVFATVAPAIAEIEVVANGLIGKVEMPDPQTAAGDLGSHEILVALVGFGLGHITDWDEVEFPGTAGCALDDAEFANRIGSGWVEFELI